MKRHDSKILKSVNKKRLIVEIILLILFIGLASWYTISKILNQAITPDMSYSKYQKLYQEVLKRDFSDETADNEDLLERIDNALNHNGSSLQKYFNLKARIEYCYRAGIYSPIEGDIEEARDYAPSEEEKQYLDSVLEKISS